MGKLAFALANHADATKKLAAAIKDHIVVTEKLNEMLANINSDPGGAPNIQPPAPPKR